MKLKIIYIALLASTFFTFLSSCTSPTEVEANRIRSITESSKTVSFNFKYLDFEYLEINQSSEKDLIVQNETKKLYTVDPIKFAMENSPFNLNINKLNLDSIGGSKSFETIKVGFSPKKIGVYSDTIYFSADKKTFVLVKGICPGIYVSDYKFNNVKVNENGVGYIKLKNYTNKTIVYDKYLVNGNFDNFIIDSIPQSLQLLPGTQKEVKVIFTPNDKNPYQIYIQFYFKNIYDGEENKLSSYITGIGE